MLITSWILIDKLLVNIIRKFMHIIFILSLYSVKNHTVYVNGAPTETYFLIYLQYILSLQGRFLKYMLR